MFAWLAEKMIAAPVIGAILGPVINGLLTAQRQKLDAVGSHEAQVTAVATQAILLDRREAEMNAQIIIAEQGNWFTRSIRPLMAMPVVFIIWKLIVYDKALGEWTHGITDKMDDHIWWVITTIIIAYMGGRSAEKVASTVAGIFGKK
jgi:hypothetical protein